MDSFLPCDKQYGHLRKGGGYIMLVSIPVRRKLAIWNHVGLNRNLKSDDIPRKLPKIAVG